MLEADSLTPEQRETERRDLLEYCKLDTEAMLRLPEKLEELVFSKSAFHGRAMAIGKRSTYPSQ